MLGVFLPQFFYLEQIVTDVGPFIYSVFELFQGLQPEFKTFATVFFESIYDTLESNSETDPIYQLGLDDFAKYFPCDLQFPQRILGVEPIFIKEVANHTGKHFLFSGRRTVFELHQQISSLID